ncbi:bacteriorhodopsin [Modestobacter sp. VKM Ac-2984]|uniref:bacteriorhodopsin n=1 Tax=Modestobacter sp. VKM Ac-2984 TaxID=3004138 RepID=UPI0022AB2848|nr:bacteriorhodopsin [Modestobacter sp. VKM Ac-2984]MCZ2818135.1 bacteriorhodopsin [Modestobacter sp. VKM Ac-2984]
MTPFDHPVPELQVMPLGLYDLVLYSLVVAGFAFFAYFVYSWNTKSEIGARYRPAVLAGLCIAGVAMVSYLVLFLKWDSGFTLVSNVYVPNEEARFTLAPRYMDWSITVPLLTAELLAVCSIAGAKARSLRFTTMAAAFLMIITGYLGSQVLQQGRDTGTLVLWGCISTVFYIYLYIALIGAVRGSMSSMGSEAGASLRNATIVLLGTFGVYPLVYAVPVFFEVTPGWLTGMQLAYSAADVLAKVGFGVLIHKVAKLRTAEDVIEGDESHPEDVWVSNVKKSDGVLPQLGKVSPALLTHFSDNRVEHEAPAHRETVHARVVDPAPVVDRGATETPRTTSRS